jgi:hypothetical protein
MSVSGLVLKQRQCLFCRPNFPFPNLARDPFAKRGFIPQHLHAFSGNIGRKARKEIPLPGAALLRHHHQIRLEKIVCDQTSTKAVLTATRLSLEQLPYRPQPDLHPHRLSAETLANLITKPDRRCDKGREHRLELFLLRIAKMNVIDEGIGIAE